MMIGALSTWRGSAMPVGSVAATAAAMVCSGAVPVQFVGWPNHASSDSISRCVQPVGPPASAAGSCTPGNNSPPAPPTRNSETCGDSQSGEIRRSNEACGRIAPTRPTGLPAASDTARVGRNSGRYTQPRGILALRHQRARRCGQRATEPRRIADRGIDTGKRCRRGQQLAIGADHECRRRGQQGLQPQQPCGLLDPVGRGEIRRADGLHLFGEARERRIDPGRHTLRGQGRLLARLASGLRQLGTHQDDPDAEEQPCGGGQSDGPQHGGRQERADGTRMFHDGSPSAARRVAGW